MQRNERFPYRNDGQNRILEEGETPSSICYNLDVNYPVPYFSRFSIWELVMRKLFLAILLSCGMMTYIGCGGAADAEGPVTEDKEPPPNLEQDIMDEYEKRGVDPSGGRANQ